VVSDRPDHCAACTHVFPTDVGEVFLTRTSDPSFPYLVNEIVETPPGCFGITSRLVARFADRELARDFIRFYKGRR
jgi:hypothetical protein